MIARLVIAFVLTGAAQADSGAGIPAKDVLPSPVLKTNAESALSTPVDEASEEFAPVIAMKNQYGDEQTLAFPQEHPHVLFAADRKGVDEVIAWFNLFHARYGDAIPVYGLAQGKSVPAVLRPVVKRIIRKRVPQPVFLDWSNAAADAWAIDAGTANVYVIAPNGAILMHIKGAVDDSKQAAFFQVLDEYLAKATKTASNEDSQPGE